MTILQLKKSRRIAHRIYALVSWAFFGFAMCVLWAGISVTTQDKYEADEISVYLALAVFMIITAIISLALDRKQMKIENNYRIELSATTISENMGLSIFLKPFRCSYDEILYVARRWQGVVEIGLTSGKYHRIAVKAMDGGKERVLEALERHIPADRFETDFKANLMRSTPMEWLILAVFLPMIVLMFLMILLLYNKYFLQFYGWEVYGRSRPLEYVLGYSIESKDSLWMVTSNIWGKNVARHYVNGKEKTQNHSSAKSFKSYSEVVVIADELENPTIISEDVNRFWNNGKWDEWKFPEGYKARFYGNEQVNIADKAWMILQGNDKPDILVMVRGGTSDYKIIPLPDEAVEKEYEPFNLSAMTNGDILVAIGDYKEGIIYFLNNTEWRDYKTPIDIPEDYSVQDCVTDARGNIYVLFSDRPNKNFVRKIDANGSVDTYIPSTSEDVSYDHLIVDVRGRLWLMSGYPNVVYVVEPMWGGEAKEIVVYNEFNSNVEIFYGVRPQLASDGKIWAAGSKLIWVDSAVENLPNPAPRWMERSMRYTHDPWVSLVFALVLLVFALALMPFALILNRPIGKKR